MRNLKISSNIYFATAILLLITSILFMTNYYNLFVYGDAEVLPVYLEIQAFNHQLFWFALIIILSVILAKTLDVGTEIFGKPAVVSTWIGAFLALVLLGYELTELIRVKALYQTIDFAPTAPDYYPSEFMFNWVGILMVIIIVFSVILAIMSSKELKKKQVR